VSERRSTFSYGTLIYIFPAAAWVVATVDLLKLSSGYQAIFVSLVFFAFLPAEVYSSSLWARERSTFTGSARRFLATVIDTLGVFFLSLLYIFYGTLWMLYGRSAPTGHVNVFILSLGALLLLNGLWNVIDRPRDIDVFLKARELAEEKAKLARDRVAVQWYSFVAGVVPILRVVNFSVFGVVLPLTGLVLLATAALSYADRLPAPMKFQTSGSVLAIFIASLLIIVTCWKLLHTYLLAYALRQVEAQSLRYFPALIKMHQDRPRIVSTGQAAIAAIADFRFRCMTADLYAAGSDRQSGVARQYSRSEISYDDWDEAAVHIAVMNMANIVGAARVNFASAHRLPFLQHLSSRHTRDIALNSDDVEISRVFVIPEFRQTQVAVEVLLSAAQTIAMVQRKKRGKLFADVLIDGPHRFNVHTYVRAGFRDTGAEYFDGRYQTRSRIYALDMETSFDLLRTMATRNFARSIRLYGRQASVDGWRR
jgi:predicted GNAT family N-acyltransferase